MGLLLYIPKTNTARSYGSLIYSFFWKLFILFFLKKAYFNEMFQEYLRIVVIWCSTVLFEYHVCLLGQINLENVN